MPFAKVPRAEPVTRRDRRRMAAAVLVLALVVAAIAVWAAVRPGSYGGSGNGCVTVTIPSTTGGALIHQCGAKASALCARAYTRTDKVSMLTRPQCKLAGLSPLRSGASTS